ncbi:AraC family transcriptional regulator [Nocardioides KLBMP 9356]|uniref:AraC family transcriptional regulator n=1 Tax=Nocardioides potassii TaxID=2911371 RepID=A0ABS9H8N9_9ACTN|nr:AraC family transcriptional regulator [Nocardioides potassii]MCF6376678.1 AraC family transcriptional regulator [Nocardioides potassii]
MQDRQEVRRVTGRTEDPREAEAVIAAAYLPSSVERIGAGPLALRLDSLELDSATVGLVSFGAESRLRTSEATNYHVNVPVTGQVVSSAGGGPRTRARSGQATVFMPDRPADIRWGQGASQLCLMLPKDTVERELEELLGRSVTRPVVFEPEMDLSGPAGRGWRASLDVLVGELTHGPHLLAHRRAARQLERLMVDGLLLAQPHTYSAELERRAAPSANRSVQAARDLLEERPEEPWSTTSLARAVHVSVRSLQEGFATHVGVPPMTYLQQVRLRRVRELLVDGSPAATTVSSAAAAVGLSHRGRFAAAYRREFGESPAETLRRT